MEFEFPDSIESTDKIPAQFRPLYVEDSDGSYKLGENYSGVREAVNGLNKSLKAARAEAKAAKGKQVDLSSLSEFGESVEDIRNNITAKLQELQEQAAKGKDFDPEKIKADLAKGFTKEREQLTTRNEALQGQLYKLLVQNEATSAISEAKGVPDLLMPFVAKQTKTVEEDGQFKVYVTDESGDVRYSGVTGAPMSIKELVGEMKADAKYGRLFESDTPSGGGTPPGAPRRPAPANKPMTANERIAAGLNRRSR